MKKNLFEMGTDLGKGWTSDNKEPLPAASASSCQNILTPQQHRLYCSKEKRRGKTVTIVQPFCLEKEVLRSLLKKLKRRLGTGGTAKGQHLEFQGDISGLLRKQLLSMGYRFKNSTGKS